MLLKGFKFFLGLLYSLVIHVLAIQGVLCVLDINYGLVQGLLAWIL